MSKEFILGENGPSESEKIDQMRHVINQHSKVIKQFIDQNKTQKHKIELLEAQMVGVKYKLENKKSSSGKDPFGGIFG